MARIRIVDAWVRSPAAPVSRQRAVMVVAEKWAEQRVLMRAYASSQDQTRPTIVLHGQQLAIGPAGTDESAAWGIHVEPPVDGRAQELRGQLELAARRLAGSKGNPPRLLDEVPEFDGKATNLWEPGTPPDPAPQSGHTAGSMPYYEPGMSAVDMGAPAGPPPPAPPQPRAAATPGPRMDPGPPPPAPPLAAPPLAAPPLHAPPLHAPHLDAPHLAAPTLAAPHRPEHRGWSSPVAPMPPLRDSTPSAHMDWPASSAGGMAVYSSRNSVKTQRGIAVGYGASWDGAGHGPALAGGQALGAIVSHTLPPGTELSVVENEVLDALGRASALTAGQIEHLTHAADGAAWMERFIAKLMGLGLDLVRHGGYVNGEAMYLLSGAPR